MEAADQVGGAAVTREFAPGFKVSACAHLVNLLDEGISRELGLAIARPELLEAGPRDDRAGERTAIT